MRHPTYALSILFCATLLLFAAAMFAYPVLRGEGVTPYTVYGEDQFELIEEIDLGDEPVVVLRAPATEHALGEVTIEPRKQLREIVSLRSSELGVTLHVSDDLQFYEWFDAQDKFLNRYPINPYITNEIVTVNTNGYWLFFEEPNDHPYAFLEPEGDDDADWPENFRYNVESSNFASQSGVTIFDSQGNMMKQVEFGCGNVYSVECSPSGNFFIVAAHPKNILMSIDGHIIREFEKSGGVSINFSPSEDLAILGGPLSLVVDLEAGEIIAEIIGSFQESAALSNKEAGIVAVTSGGDGIHVYDIWAQKQIARFRKDGGNIQLSGDGQLLSFRTWGKSNKLYTYLLDDKGGE